MVIFNASFAPISHSQSYHKGGGSQGLFNHNFLLIFIFKIVLGYMTRCKVLPCNADKRGSTSTYFFDPTFRTLNCHIENFI
jgi:hypothetical protein